jgi:hypothetical protein
MNILLKKTASKTSHARPTNERPSQETVRCLFMVLRRVTPTIAEADACCEFVKATKKNSISAHNAFALLPIDSPSIHHILTSIP